MKWEQQTGEKEQIQERRYAFPYHYLAHKQQDAWWIGRYELQGYRYLSLLDSVIALVHHYQPKRLLDFGCGDGRLLYELANKFNGQMIGVDISQRALWQAQAASAPYSHVSFYRDLEEIPLEPLDLIIAMEVIEHIPPEMLPGLLRRLHVTLAENGRFVITVPTTNEPVAKKHYQHFDHQKINRLVEGLFNVEKISYVHQISLKEKLLRRTLVNRFFMTTWKPWLKYAARTYQRTLLPATANNGAGLIAVCQKI